MMRLTIAAIVGAGIFVGLAQASSDSAALRYQNCTAMHKPYPHGVGKWGARDHTSGTPVTNFKRSNILYRQNRTLDHDKDGIACGQK